MRICLYDEIIENHVVHSLSKALSNLGHTVKLTGPVWNELRYPNLAEDRLRVEAHLKQTVEDFQPDVLIAMRTLTIRPEWINWLRDRNITTGIWLSDDPVLYKETARAIDQYDLPLHGGGGAAILAYYDSKGHKPGVFFPFWADLETFSGKYQGESTEDHLVFMGNCTGRFKSERYKLLEGLGQRLNRPVSIYGKVGEDPSSLGRGYIDTNEQLIEMVLRGKLGVNIPQSMSHYAGSRFDFPELGGLGVFDVPSRVVQYAALAVPTLTIGSNQQSEHFPTMMIGPDVTQPWRFLPELLDNVLALESVGNRSHELFRSTFTAEHRALYLEQLLQIDTTSLSFENRVFGYRDLL